MKRRNNSLNIPTANSAKPSQIPFDYQITQWGQPYFSINPDGKVAVTNPGTLDSCSIFEIVQLAKQKNLDAPLLLRFPFVVRHRIEQINAAFQFAIQEFQYPNSYQCVFPVKANQHAHVIDSIVDGNRLKHVGLEAGSKAELLLIIARATPDTPIFYNGFKDRSSIEMAVRASRCGLNVTVIIEKPIELVTVVQVCRQLNHKVRLGIRIKLASRGSGHWEHSGGLRSKFGLFVPQLLAAVEKLKANDMLDALQLLHFHPGSQINDILKIKASVIEATRIYCGLIKQGVPLTTLDVGGGLAVDYTGEKSTSPSSMNYSLQEYANDIVYYIKRVCDQTQVEPPEIVTESGRAVVAHHSVLVIPVLGSSYREIDEYDLDLSFDETDLSLQPLVELKATYEDITADNLIECFHDAQQAIDMTLQLFASGMLSLTHRSIAEKLFWKVCRRIREHFNTLGDVPTNLGELKELFAETYIGNFSLFQSLRDHWAINQLFPVMPIQNLDQRPDLHAVLGDITCDSDGRIGCFISEKENSHQSAVRVHSLAGQSPYYLAVFLTGAYQEAIGQQHNLLGKTHSVSIEFQNGCPHITTINHGTTLGQALSENGYSMENQIASLESTHPEDVEHLLSCLSDYCYLSPEETNQPVDETVSKSENFKLNHHLKPRPAADQQVN